MRKDGRSRRAAAALLTMGALLAAGGCSKLQASLDKRDTVTLGDLAARVSALEQRIQDVEAGTAREANGQVASEPFQAGQDASNTGRSEANKPTNGGTRAVVRAGILNVRAQPSTQAQQVGQLAQGAIVQVLAVEGDWAKVKVTDKNRTVTGWVANQFLEQQE